MVGSSKALIDLIPGMKKMNRPDRLHLRSWYSAQDSGIAQAAGVGAAHGLAAAPDADGRRVPLTTGTGA
ncbi:MAG: hypothetical protein IPH51_19210 [Rubrivivax sp.]|nr:hypothetical protein [Rubrivivax sp.]